MLLLIVVFMIYVVLSYKASSYLLPDKNNVTNFTATSTNAFQVMTSKATNLSKKVCDSKSTEIEKAKCYLQLAKEAGDLGYCWKYQASFSVCMKEVILYRHDPSLCNNLHPDSRVGCLKAYEAAIK